MVTEEFSLGGTSRGHPVLPSAQSRSGCSRLLRTVSRLVLSTCEDRDVTSPLGTCASITTLVVRKTASAQSFARCLLSCHCTPLRKVWLCLLWALPFEKKRQQRGLPDPPLLHEPTSLSLSPTSSAPTPCLPWWPYTGLAPAGHSLS